MHRKIKQANKLIHEARFQLAHAGSYMAAKLLRGKMYEAPTPAGWADSITPLVIDIESALEADLT